MVDKRKRQRQPDLVIEAIVTKPARDGQEAREVLITVGEAWRTEDGDYSGELLAEPPEWQHSAGRRLLLRVNEARR